MANGKAGAPLGNDNYRKGKMVEDALRKAAVQEDFKRLRKGVEKVWDAFAEGDPWAVAFVRDTFDGKPAQSVALEGGDPNRPVGFKWMDQIPTFQSFPLNQSLPTLPKPS